MPTRIRIADGPLDWTLEVDASTVRFMDDGVALGVTREGDGRYTVTESGTRTPGVAVRHGHVVWVAIDGVVMEFAVSRAGGRVASIQADAFAAPMPATVVRIAVQPGQAVRQGDVLVALEAMKMEFAIRAPRDGVIRAIHCREGDLAHPGHALIEMIHADDVNPEP